MICGHLDGMRVSVLIAGVGFWGISVLLFARLVLIRRGNDRNNYCSSTFGGIFFPTRFRCWISNRMNTDTSSLQCYDNGSPLEVKLCMFAKIVGSLTRRVISRFVRGIPKRNRKRLSLKLIQIKTLAENLLLGIGRLFQPINLPRRG